MKDRTGRARGRHSKSNRPAARRQKEHVDAGMKSLLKEVSDANAKAANPEERERVIPSRPC